MAYVGNPIDTQNTFQSLVGKRFNGDGSTTDFTLDVAPGSTLDIEVFVGNVRQDPNSAYTVSGTTLSFTGAPPSGTNNIYVVHQAKSVGTIDVPSSFTSSAQTFSGGLTSSGTTTVSGALNATGGLDSRGGAVFNEGSADEDFRIESNGNTHQIFVDGGNDRVIVGSDTSVTADSLQPSLQVNGTTEATSAVGIHRASNDTGGAQLIFSKTRNTSVGGNTVIQNGDTYGEILFLGNDGGDLASAGAKIAGISSSAPGTNDMPSSLVFSTTANAANTFSERMRIASEGKVLIAAEDFTNNIAAGNGGISLFNTNSGSLFFGFGTGTETQMNFGNDNGVVGSIQTSGSGTSFNTSSDYRLKENVDYTWDATTRLKQLKPARFNFIADDTNTLLDGFLAHEVSSIVPEAVSGEKDATETKTKVVVSSKGGILAEGIEQSDWTQGKESGKYPSDSTWEASNTSIIAQTIDQSKLVPLLVKTVQELEARIKALEEA